MIPFSTSMAGPAKADASVSLRQEGGTLSASFYVAAPGFFNPDFEAFTFVEGLWHYDCAEMFIGSVESGRYLEVNLAPNGAWWTCLFEDVRKRDAHTPRPKLSIGAELQPHAWRASFSISIRDLVSALNATSEDELIGNCTLVLGGCPDVDVPLQNLHSLCELGAVDFHRPKDWVPLSDLLMR